ncbi:hypothetical protein NT6N_30870 [Oceaniferula spumae]|uniref:Uncharacterized protein n=1 Tax=Oceaniferula spumae TaxID=2979115 RepID=A0AAT9FPI8_9BACT
MEISGQIVVLILFVVISGIQWLIKRIQERNSPPDTSESLEDIYDDYREEIRRHQTQTQAPPPTPQASQPPPIPSASPQHQVEAPAAYQRAIQQARQQKPTLTPAQKEAAERFQQLGKRKRRRKSAVGQISARALLSSPQSARQAVILHEVFGPPKSMRKY